MQFRQVALVGPLTVAEWRSIEVFKKRTQQTPKAILVACQRRLKEYDDA